MTYGLHRRGYSISRQILSGINCFTDGRSNQLVGACYATSGGLIVTRQSYIETITVQLPQPRGNNPISAYLAGYPPQSALSVVSPNPTEAIWYFWDITTFNPSDFVLNPLPLFPPPDDAVMQIRPWGNGVSGGGAGSDPPSARTSTTGSYTIDINRRFKDGLMAFFQNPEKTAVLTLQNRVGNFVVGDNLTGGGAGSGTGGRVRVVEAAGDTLVLQPDWVFPITHYTVGRGITGSISGATADVLTYEAQLLQQVNCQVNMIWCPTQIR